MNILGRPFQKFVTDQINTRQDSLKKGIGNSADDLLYQQSKTPWLRMASSVDIDTDIVTNPILESFIGLGFSKADIAGKALSKNFMLQGGAITTTTDSFTANSGINFETNFDGAYGWGGTTERGAIPMPGLTGASVKYINNGALTKTEVTGKCFSRNQLALIDALYMRPGYTVLLEFGWSNYLDNNGNLQEFDGFNTKPLRYLFDAPKDQYKLLTKIKEETQERFGNYEGVYGKISNFNWKFNPDGSYDWSVTLVGVGEIIESLKINTINLGKVDGEEEEQATEEGELPVIAQASRSSMNAWLYAVYQGNGFWEDPDHEFRDRALSNFCFIDDDGNTSISTLKMKNAEFHCDIKEVDDDKWNTGPQIYVTFGYLMAWIQKNILLKNEDIPCCAFDMDFKNLENDKNFFRFPQGNFSSQPLECIVPFQQPAITKAGVTKAANVDFTTMKSFYSTIATKYFGYGVSIAFPEPDDVFKVVNKTLTKSFRKDSQNARLSMILLNINNIAKILEECPEDEDNAKSLNDFLKKIMQSINKSTGGINDFVVELSDDQSKIVFRNRTPQSFDSDPPELAGKLCKFNTFGPGSMIKNLAIDGNIPSNFSSMVTIGSQANGNSAAGDATSFSNYNTGLIDRVMPVKDTRGGSAKKGDSKGKKETANIVKVAKMINTMTTAGGFWDRLSGGAGGVWEDIMDDLEWLSEDIATFNSNHTQYIQNLQGYLAQPKESGGAGLSSVAFFLPFNFNMDIEGISGIRLFERFKIDDKVLPLSYDNDNVNILVKTVDHDINLSGWTTKIGTISAPAKK